MTMVGTQIYTHILSVGIYTSCRSMRIVQTCIYTTCEDTKYIIILLFIYFYFVLLYNEPKQSLMPWLLQA